MLENRDRMRMQTDGRIHVGVSRAESGREINEKRMKVCPYDQSVESSNEQRQTGADDLYRTGDVVFALLCFGHSGHLCLSTGRGYGSGERREGFHSAGARNSNLRDGPAAERRYKESA